MQGSIVRPSTDLFLSGGEMGTLVRAHDWARTSVGPLEHWPQSLRTAVGIVLRSPAPMVLLWGWDGVMIYNDAYSRFAGSRHPGLLGAKVRDGWQETVEFADMVMPRILAGEALSFQDQELILYREGTPERVWLNLDYTPVFDESGRPAGALLIVSETTERVRDQARLRDSEARLLFLDGLATATQPLTDPTAIMKVTAKLLGEHMAADVCAYADMEPDQDGFTIRGDWTAQGSESIVGFYSLDAFGEIAAGLLRAGRPLVTRDTLADLGPEQARALLSLGLKATVCMPLVREGRLTALMAVHSATPRDWTADELSLIRETTERSWAYIERIHAEAALRASEARLRAVVDVAPVGLLFADASGRITGGNQQFERIVGHPLLPSPNVGAYRDWIAFHPDGRRVEGKEYPLARALAGEDRPELEVQYQRGDGRLAWVRFVAAAKRGVNGGVVGGVVAALDIDAERRAQADLRDLNGQLERRVDEVLAERKLWADIFETTDALIAVLAPDYRYLAVNEAYAREFEAIFGVRPTVGSSLLDLLATQPEDLAAAKAIWDRALSGEAFTAVEEFGSPDRKRPYYELRFGALRDRDGGLVGAFQYAQDVTERLRNQNKLLQAEEALRQSQQMEAVGQLTGGVAHDFNNLLTIIRSSTDLLRRPNLPEERRRRYIDAIAETVGRASKLTGQLLAFARRQALKPEVFDVPDRLNAITDMLRTVLGARIQIRTEVDCEQCFVEADVTQFETALVNMAVNARDAMDGEGTLTIRVAATEHATAPASHAGGAAGHVEVSITDTGSGISPDEIPHIFEPFFTTKEVGKGTGLGLSQVYGFAKQSGGDVVVESEVGRGTTFILSLPKSRAPEVADATVGDRVPSEGGRGRRVLVVEDNEDVGRFSTQILQDLGYETTWAMNAHDALKRLEGDRAFDVVFSDVVMPGMTGVELGREIRRRYPGMPVILTSGYSHVLAEEGRHGFELVQKPYAAEELSTVLRRATATGRVHDAR